MFNITSKTTNHSCQHKAVKDRDAAQSLHQDNLTDQGFASMV